MPIWFGSDIKVDHDDEYDDDDDDGDGNYEKYDNDDDADDDDVATQPVSSGSHTCPSGLGPISRWTMISQ